MTRNKLNIEEVRKVIESDEYKLLSTTYVNSKTRLEMKCGPCGLIFKQTFSGFRQGHRHPKCTVRKGVKNPSVNPVLPKRKCMPCGNIFQAIRKSQIYCDRACANIGAKSEERLEMSRRIGRESAAIQVKRSKNEVCFAELCAAKFTILTNEPMFDGWDADVIIPAFRLAIHWNGIWHYKKVREGQNLKLIQNRDRIKKIRIERHGYSSYTIKDMGSFSKKFVQAEFNKFMDFLYFI